MNCEKARLFHAFFLKSLEIDAASTAPSVPH